MHDAVKRIRYACLVATAGLVLAGCGDDATSGAGRATTTPVPGSPGSTNSASPAADVLPLTVTRTGGVVGFSDRVVVGSDGTATITKRGGEPTRCRLEPSLMNGLVQGAKAIDWAKVGTNRPTPRHPDDLIIAVATQEGSTRLDDPLVKPLVAPVGKLLIETTAPARSHKLCKPV
jgi:hypothetical protein